MPIDEIRGVGGGAIGSAWTQIIADILGRPVLSMAAPQDATARGAAACAIIGIGLQPDTSFARETAVIERVHRPSPDATPAATDAYGRYRRLYEALRPVYEDQAAWRAGVATTPAPTAASTPATIPA